MNSTIICSLHTGGDINEKIIPFTQATLKRCREKQNLRKTNQKKASRFDHIELPESPDGYGYHASCNRYFNSSVKPPKNTDDGKYCISGEKFPICVIYI